MNSLLPNLRWLCLPSDNLGQDWFQKARSIDQVLAQEGMDLAEETTFLLFSNAPSDILEGIGECVIARAVIGPKKNLTPPWMIQDWRAAPVWREVLQGQTLTEFLENAEERRLKANKIERSFAEPFILSVRRHLDPDLRLSVECLFHE